MEQFVCLPYLKVEKPILFGPLSFDGSIVSIREDIPGEERIPLLMDAMHLLYFAAFYSPLYHELKAPYFEYFTYMTAANTPPNTASQEQIITLPPIDEHMTTALGNLLNSCYVDEVKEARTTVRAIRYFTHCFSGSFSLPFGNEAFEPEDMVFLVTAFETLLNLDPANPIQAFKLHFRHLVNLKYGKPLETFWKWIEEFYEIHHSIIHEGKLPDSIFRGNPNFETNTMVFAIKLFIYSAHWKLHQLGLIQAIETIPQAPLEFPHVDALEITPLLWNEESLLHKISLLLMQVVYGEKNEESVRDLKMLTLNYDKILTHAFSHSEGIQFIPSPKESIEKQVDAILRLSGELIEEDGKKMRPYHFFPDHFLEKLQKRVA